MPDELLSQSLANISKFMAAAGALGTAAYGLIDSSKAIAGGMSNPGFGYIRKEVERILGSAAEKSGGAGGLPDADILATLRANWLNGVAKSDQKAAAKSLIRMRITPENAEQLANATGVDATALKDVAQHIRNGDQLTQKDINLIGRLDTVVSALLDLGYERADQFYRNSAKLAATFVAVALAVVGGGLIHHNSNPSVAISGYFGSSDFLVALLVGAISTPLAPVAKDLSTALSTAVKAVGAVKR
ncbi:MAG: hypothetical protein ACLQAT_13545 [Candidatus Binataceae bacterium]